MKKGAILSYILIFIFVFTILLVGILNFILNQLRISQERIYWHQAFNIAEAGLEYYKWCLNNDTEQTCYLQKEYEDINGNTIGSFQLQVGTNSSCGLTISQNIISTGVTQKFPNVKRKISAFYVNESVAKYSYILNSNVWVGADQIIRGPYLSNSGIRFDGQNLSTVSSAQEKWECTNFFGCGPNGVGYGLGLCPPECQIIEKKCICPGVFSTTQNSNRGLFLFPVPLLDFEGITTNLAQIKDATKNQRLGLYFGPSNAFGYRITINQENLKVWKVTSVDLLENICIIVNDTTVCDGEKCRPECPQCVSNKCKIQEPVPKTEELIFDGIVPQNCGTVFFEDNLWVGKKEEPLLIKGKVTIASADLITPGQKTSVWLAGNINYTNYEGADGLTIVSQGDNLIALHSPDNMVLRGIFIAQKGRFGRNHYPCAKYPNYCIRNSLSIFGSIISAGHIGTQWITLGGQIVSGYRNRETYVDKNLIYNPPPFTPFLFSRFGIIKWEEL